ncbi:MAG: type II toxin-antitoxin system RelE/ParE family toxin [Chloroflexota bacterium]|nr:type II toxin-antitoxin system RelE/ParE family toxin [Chloroflexota bacterium]
MRFYFADRKLKHLYTDENDAHKYPEGVVDAFFDVMAQIAAARDERDLYAMKGLRYEKLKGKRSHQRSLRLNDQFRLIVEREEDEEGKLFRIVAIEDYH